MHDSDPSLVNFYRAVCVALVLMMVFMLTQVDSFDEPGLEDDRIGNPVSSAAAPTTTPVGIFIQPITDPADIATPAIQSSQKGDNR